VLLEPLIGKYDLGERQVNDKSLAVMYWKDAKGSVSYHYKSHDLWFLTESVRWGFLPKETLTNAKQPIDRVNREDLWKKAAKSLGVAAADMPTSTSRGVEKFFDGLRLSSDDCMIANGKFPTNTKFLMMSPLESMSSESQSVRSKYMTFLLLSKRNLKIPKPPF
jgi:hypothetical protein